MKILVVCQYYYPEPFRIPDICREMAARGHEITVVTGTPNYPEGVIYKGYENGAREEEVLDGVRVHRCPLIPRKQGALYRFLNYYSFVFSSHRYLRRLKEDFDVVFVNQLSPVMMAQSAQNWAKRHGKKCVLYCLDLWPESLLAGGIQKDSAIYKVFLAISRRIYRKADALLITSLGFRDYFRDWMGISEEKIHYLPQYAEDMFGQVKKAEQEQEGVHFLFAGNVGQSQTVETIVEAARLLADEKQIYIHIVGGGISLEKCRELAYGLENITFYGRRDLSEMPAFYSRADAMLVTLVDDPVLSLTLPGKVQSYMAAGKPVIGAIGGETARLIQEADCGACANAEDAEGLARVIREAAADPENLKRQGENARRYYDAHFRKEIFMKTLLDILQENCERT